MFFEKKSIDIELTEKEHLFIKVYVGVLLQPLHCILDRLEGKCSQKNPNKMNQNKTSTLPIILTDFIWILNNFLFIPCAPKIWLYTYFHFSYFIPRTSMLPTLHIFFFSHNNFFLASACDLRPISPIQPLSLFPSIARKRSEMSPVS